VNESALSESWPTFYSMQILDLLMDGTEFVTENW